MGRLGGLIFHSLTSLNVKGSSSSTASNAVFMHSVIHSLIVIHSFTHTVNNDKSFSAPLLASLPLRVSLSGPGAGHKLTRFLLLCLC